MVHIDEIIARFRALPDDENLRVLDAVLTDLAKPGERIEYVWAIEARKRWNGYKTGQIRTVSYEELMRKYDR